MSRAGERLLNGLVKENPTFVLMLGMCPTLAVTAYAINGLGMGLATTAVLTMSNLLISILRKVIPNRIRIPAFIVIIASFVTVIQLLMEAYLPTLNKALGVYIPLIVVNCIILGRAESYAYGNPPIPSLFDGLGMGLGFTVALTCIGAVREILAQGSVFGYGIMPESYVTINIFGLAPGAFFVLAALTAVQNYVKIKGKKKGKDYKKLRSGCSEDCLNCPDTGCGKRFYDTGSDEKKSVEKELEKKEPKKKESKKKEQKEREQKKKEPVPAGEIKTEKTKIIQSDEELDSEIILLSERAEENMTIMDLDKEGN